MGRVRLAINEVAAAGEAGITRGFTLLNERFEFGETNRGELNLTVRWVFDQATHDLSRRMAATRKSSIFRKIGKLMGRARRNSEETKEEKEEVSFYFT